MESGMHKRRRRVTLVAMLSAALFAAALFGLCYRIDNRYTHPQPPVVNGSLSLAGGELEEYGVIFLAQGWESFRRDGPRGNGVYSLQIVLPDQPRCYVLELQGYTPGCVIYVNGEHIAGPGESPQGYSGKEAGHGLAVFKAGGPTELIVEVAGDALYYSGTSAPPAFGETQAMLSLLGWRLIFRVAISFGTLLLGFLCVITCVRSGRYRDAWLYGLLCLAVVGHIAAPLAQLPDWNGSLLWYRVESACCCAVPLLAVHLQNRLCGIPSRVSKITILCAALLCAATLFPLLAPAEGGLRMYSIYGLAVSVYLAAILIQALAKGSGGPVLLMAALSGYAVLLAIGRLFPLFAPIQYLRSAEMAGAVLILGVGIHFAWEAGGVARARAAMAEQVRDTARLLDTRMEQDAALTEKIREIEAAQHDQRHHLAVMRVLWEKGAYEQLGSYLGAYEEQRLRTGTATLCRSFVADAVLRHYLELARREDILLTVEADIPERTAFSDAELCALLSNLLENAVEACRLLPAGERRIDFAARRSNGMLVITLRNSFSGGAAGRGGRFLSRKRGGAAAGSGLDSVRRIVQSHGGIAEFEADSAKGEFHSLVQAAVLVSEELKDAQPEAMT